MICCIVKVDSNRVIGDSHLNRMPRETSTDPDIIAANRSDMKHFVGLRKSGDLTNIVIMWRKTWESIPTKYRPFDHNINYIISRNLELDVGDTKWEEVQVFGSVEESLAHISDHHCHTPVYIIGGGQIYQYVIEHHLVDVIYMTILKGDFIGDVYFPQLWPERKEIMREDFDHHSFITYQKNPTFNPL